MELNGGHLMAERTEYFGVWLTEYAEWLGSTATVTPPDALHKNTATREPETRRQAQRHLSSAARKARSCRPFQIPLWRTRAQARAEIRTWEPDKYEPGSESVRLYGRLTRDDLVKLPERPDDADTGHDAASDDDDA